MKKSHLILSALILVSAFSVGFTNKANQEPPSGSIAVIRTLESNGIGSASNLTVVYPDGSSATIKLQGIKSNDLQRNLVPITKAFNDMAAKGYKLVTSNVWDGSGNANNSMVSTYVFVKQ